MRHFLFSIVVFFIACIAHANEQNAINISAEGKVKTQADMAVFSLAIQTTEFDAKRAHDTIDKQVKTLLKRLKKYSVDEGSLDSSQTSITAEYDYKSKPRSLIGYRATRQVEFQLADLKQMDDIVSDISQIEFTNINSVQFSVKDTQYFEDLALMNAIQIAKHKAELIANEFGRELGHILKVTHQVSSRSAPVFARAMSLEMDNAKTSSYEQKDIEMNAFIEVSFSFK